MGKFFCFGECKSQMYITVPLLSLKVSVFGWEGNMTLRLFGECVLGWPFTILGFHSHILTHIWSYKSHHYGHHHIIILAYVTGGNSVFKQLGNLHEQVMVYFNSPIHCHLECYCVSYIYVCNVLCHVLFMCIVLCYVLFMCIVLCYVLFMLCAFHVMCYAICSLCVLYYDACMVLNYAICYVHLLHMVLCYRLHVLYCAMWIGVLHHCGLRIDIVCTCIRLCMFYGL